MVYEIIISNEKEALGVTLPDELIEKIKKLSPDKNLFENQPNKEIVKILIKSLDKLILAHQYSDISDEPEKCDEGVVSQKRKTDN